MVIRKKIRLGLALVIITLLFLEKTACAQNTAIDSLIARQSALKQQKSSPGRDTLLVTTLNLLTERLFNQNDPRAPAYLDSLRQLTAAVKWPKGEGLYLRAVGKSYDVKGKYTEAFNAYTKAIAALERAGGDPYDLTYTYVLAAFVLNNNGMPQRCIEYLQKARPLAEKNENTNNLCWILDYFGDYNYYDSFGVKNYRKALSYYKQVEALLPRATSPNLKADNPHCLANVYYKLGYEQLADQYRDKALTIARQYDNRVVIFAIYADLAEIAEEKGQYEKAIDYRRKSLEFATASGWREMQSRAENYLYQAYKKAGDYKSALDYLEMHRTHEDSMQRYQVQQKYDELRASYDAEKREIQIKELENKSLTQARNFLIILLLSGAGLMAYAVWTNRRLKGKNEQLTNKNREIEEALARGQTMERKRMASELHDNLNTKIAAVRWRLEALGGRGWAPSDQKIIGDVLEMIDDVYGDIRLISHNLVPEELETKGLKAAIQKLVGKLKGNDKVLFSFVFDGQDRRLNTAVEYQLYTIVLELVNNIIKHAEARHAWISLTYQSSRVILTVTDDGKGFKPPTPGLEGVGLRNIQTRVEQLKGTWQVESMPQHTRITVEIPVEAVPVTESYT
jgi:two-component system, NarL family, sensor kinase